MKKSMAYGVRQPAVAGMFYPADKQELLLMMKNFFQKTKKIISEEKKIKALIVPHAGYLYSGQTAAWGYNQLPEKLANNHFVLIGLSHHFAFDGLCVSRVDYWQTPLGRVKHLSIFQVEKNIFASDRPHLQEHCLEVQLPLLQFLYKKFLISCLLTGQRLDYQKIADWLLKHYSKSIFIISSDLSHYLPASQAEKKDKKTIEAVLNFDRSYFLNEENTACGMMGILILLELAKKLKWKKKIIYYDSSATASGDNQAVVGYASIGFYV